MSQMDLTIGRLPDDLADRAAAALDRFGIHDSPAWRQCPPNVATINLFNLATVVLFLDHAAKVEGFEKSSKALEHTRFRNLPWWQMSVWLPLSFQPPPEPAMEDSGWPVFLGSSHGLLTDLAEIQKLSELGLGAVPDGYEQMLADDEAFWRADFRQCSKAILIQWIWRGLHDAAQLSISNSAPILCIGL